MSEVDNSCLFKSWCDLTSESKDSHRSLCFILTFNKICVFLMKRMYCNTQTSSHERNHYLFIVYRKKIQYSIMLLISTSQRHIITTTCRFFPIFMMDKQHNICFKNTIKLCLQHQNHGWKEKVNFFLKYQIDWLSSYSWHILSYKH